MAPYVDEYSKQIEPIHSIEFNLHMLEGLQYDVFVPFLHLIKKKPIVPYFCRND